MDRGYKVLKLNDLVKQLGLPSSKSYKTTDYLELVINSIEKTGLRFVQFLQLVDVLYVVVQKVGVTSNESYSTRMERTEVKRVKEIPKEYQTNSSNITKKESSVSEKMEYPEELKEVKQRDTLDKSMSKNKLPWQH